MDATAYAAMWRVAQVCCGADSTLAAGIVADAVAATRRRDLGTPAGEWQALCRLIVQRVPAAGGSAGVDGLRRAVCDLPRDQRLAIALLDVAALDPRLAAAAVGRSRGALLRLRRRALAALGGHDPRRRAWRLALI